MTSIKIYSIAKNIVNSSYDTYGESVPDNLKENVDEYQFKVINYRYTYKDKIASEETDLKFKPVFHNFKKCTVKYTYSYKVNYANGNNSNSPATECELYFECQNGAWVVVGYHEDP